MGIEPTCCVLCTFDNSRQQRVEELLGVKDLGHDFMRLAPYLLLKGTYLHDSIVSFGQDLIGAYYPANRSCCIPIDFSVLEKSEQSFCV